MSTVRMTLKLNPSKHREHADEKGCRVSRPASVAYRQPERLAWDGRILLLERLDEFNLYGCYDEHGDCVEYRISDATALLGRFAHLELARARMIRWSSNPRNSQWSSFRRGLIRRVAQSLGESEVA